MESDVQKQRMVVFLKEYGIKSVEFPFALQDNMLLRLGAPIQAINVSCYVCEGAIHITFEPYSDGLAPVLIANHTSRMQLEYFQEGAPAHGLLDAMEGTMFTWLDPAKDKLLQWAPYDICRRIGVKPTFLSKFKSPSLNFGKTSPNSAVGTSGNIPVSTSSSSICSDIPPATKYHNTDVTKDGLGSFQADPDTKIYWVSFMDRKQRVLLFTEDQQLAMTLHSTQAELERKNLEMTLKIAAVGLSLVDNKSKTELVYTAITPSAVEWQFKAKGKRRFKAFSKEETNLLESAFDLFERKKAMGELEPNELFSIHKNKADFINMLLFKGGNSSDAVEIKRQCQEGIWVNCGFSDFHSHFHFKLNRIQIDNQTPDAHYQTALAPVAPPKSVAADATVPKPFIEMSLLLRKQSDAQMLLFKYCKVLIQEMAVQVDLPFILQLAQFFAVGDISNTEEIELFKKDIEKTLRPLEKTDLGPEISGGQKHFFELLHVSPLKLHLSFSPKASGQSVEVALGDVGNFFLTSFGIVSGDITDAVFRLGYFQQQSMLLTFPQLINSMQSHYTQQALRQFFNVLLGFDVIGNPVGVLRGFASGVENLFYEPWQGAIQGPEELAMGVAIGVHQFFGKTVGGVSGALSKVTGTVGGGLAKLTFDDEYQRERSRGQRSNKTVGQNLAYGGQQLVTGVFDGITGIVRKPVEGAQKEGVEGFFKGLGVGLVGVVARPTTGVVDFASTGLDTIRRVTDAAEEVKRLRPPRLILPDGIIRAYTRAEAEANQILSRLAKGQFKAEVYAGHLLLSRDGKRLLLVTERGVIGCSRSDIINNWDLDFNYTWNELRALPSLGNEGIVLPLKERQKRVFFTTSQHASRIVTFQCEEKLAEVSYYFFTTY